MLSVIFLPPALCCINIFLEAEVDFVLGNERTQGTHPAGFLMSDNMSADAYI